jgi:type 1 glutamine amidotransferase
MKKILDVHLGAVQEDLWRIRMKQHLNGNQTGQWGESMNKRFERTVLVALCTLATAVVGVPKTHAATMRAPQKRAIRALLVLGGCCHDYAKQKEILTKGISERANVEWTVAYDPDTGTKHLNPVYENSDWSKGFDVVVHDECTSDVTDLESINKVLNPHRAGLPAVILHCGMHSYRSEGFPTSTPWFDFTGVASTGHGPQLPIAIAFQDPKNPITKGLFDWTTVNEELYNNSAGKLLPTATLLARGKQTVLKGAEVQILDDAVCVWTNNYNGKTRVFATTLGHNNTTVEDARYLELVTRGLLWSVNKLDKDGKPAAGYGPTPK